MEERILAGPAIAAVSTPVGTGAVAVVRVSGKSSVDIVDTIFRPSGRSPLRDCPTHTIQYGWIVDPQTKAEVDEVLVMLMRSPRTFTREDVVEINCHGGAYVQRRILELLFQSGARPAEPGEFTKRAFLNGRMDLSQAEAVMDVIAAQTDLSLRSSVNSLKGGLGQKIDRIRGLLLELMAQMEANIDYPEYDVEEVTLEAVQQCCEAILSDMEGLWRTADSGRILQQGIRTAIVGRPNVGKSSLLNALLQQQRAIVADVPGTTRDTIEESVDLGGVPLRLIDTAGIRDTEDAVEKIGVTLARQVVEDSDLVLMVLDAGAGCGEEERALFQEIRHKEYLLLLNKSDLKTARGVEEIVMELGEPQAREHILAISAKEEEGLGDVVRWIKERFLDGGIVIGRDPMISNLRQKEALRRGMAGLRAVLRGVGEGIPQDMLLIDLADACDAVGEISGHSVRDDVIQEIFSRFCLGK